MLPSASSHSLGGIGVLRAPGSEMIRLPAGTFEMGSSHMEVLLVLGVCRREPLGSRCEEAMFAREREPHRVTLSAYWMDRYEVTWRDYQRCVQAGQCTAPNHEQGATRFRRPELPAVLVSWNDAQAYCAFVGKRLPTEAEWERAARGLRGRRYPWGDHHAERRANHGRFAPDRADASDGYSELAPVGSFPDGQSPEGFHDLAGNAAEWVADIYEDAYEAMPVTDPVGPSMGAFRVVRGGDYLRAMPWLRAAARDFRSPGTREPTIGFRCAASRLPTHTILP